MPQSGKAWTADDTLCPLSLTEKEGDAFQSGKIFHRHNFPDSQGFESHMPTMPMKTYIVSLGSDPHQFFHFPGVLLSPLADSGSASLAPGKDCLQPCGALRAQFPPPKFQMFGVRSPEMYETVVQLLMKNGSTQLGADLTCLPDNQEPCPHQY